jgi:general secretion pathway protein H
MRTSSSSRTVSCGRSRRRGFTLIEVLVVIVILGLLAAAVSIKLAPDARQSLREEAVRLAAVLTHARDEAITTGAALAWQRTDTGYRFVQRAPDRSWVAITDDPGLRPRSLPGGVRFTAIELAAGQPGAEPFILLSATGTHDPFRITLALGEHATRVSSDGVHAPVVEDSRR